MSLPPRTVGFFYNADVNILKTCAYVTWICMVNIFQNHDHSFLASHICIFILMPIPFDIFLCIVSTQPLTYCLLWVLLPKFYRVFRPSTFVSLLFHQGDLTLLRKIVLSIYLKSDRRSDFKKLRSNFAAAVYRTIYRAHHSRLFSYVSRSFRTQVDIVMDYTNKCLDSPCTSTTQRKHALSD